jgi:hypothetical protein
MKVLLVYENEAEREVAERCARVASAEMRRIAQTLAVVRGRHVDSISITSRALSFKEVVDSVILEPDIRQYITGLENAVFVNGGRL